MPGATLATIDPILKDLYGPRIQDQFQNDTPLLLFAKKAEKIPFVGRKFVLPIKTGRNRGYGFTPEGQAMPQAGNQKYTDVNVTPAYWYGRYQLTAQSIEQSRNDAGAFARGMAKEAQGLGEDQTKAINQLMYLPNTGVRGTVSGIAGSVVTLTGPAKGIEVDMKVDVYTPDFVTKRNSTDLVVTVTTDAGKNDTAVIGFTFTGTAAGIAASDVVVMKTTINNGQGQGIYGLKQAINDAGSYLTVDPAAFSIWKAQHLTNPSGAGTQRSVSEDLVQQAMDVTRQRSGKKPDFHITTFNQRRRFYNSLAPNRRFVNTRKLVSGGVELVDWDGTDILVDPDCPNFSWFGLTKETWATVQTRDGHWVDEDGHIMHRALDDSDSYFATWRWFFQLFTEQRNANVWLDDLTE